MARPLLLAHRGRRAAGPENSRRSVVEAFRRSDGAEVDVLVTAEGLPVLRHDDRTADGHAVRSLPLADLRRRVGADDDDLPEVATVLAAVRGVGGPGSRLNLELKVPGAARALLPLAGALDRVTFTSFFATEVQDAIRLFPGVPAGLLLAHEPARFVPAGVALLSVRHAILPAVRAAFPGIAIWAWTVNDPAAAARAREAGCAAVIGDDVDAMRAWFP